MSRDIELYQEHIGITIDVLANEIREIARTVAPNFLIAFRVKDPDTLRKKMALKSIGSIFSVDDVYGIRVIVETEAEGYKVLEEISKVFSGYLGHDYFKTPKVSTLSTIKEKVRLLQFIAYKNDVAFEVQITTFTHHAVNEPLHNGYHRRKYYPNNP